MNFHTQLRLTAGITILAYLVMSMLNLEKRNQLCSLHTFAHIEWIINHSHKYSVMPAHVNRKSAQCILLSHPED